MNEPAHHAPNPFASPLATPPAETPREMRYARRRPGLLLVVGMLWGAVYGCIGSAFIYAVLGFGLSAFDVLQPRSGERGAIANYTSPIAVAFMGAFAGGVMGLAAGFVLGAIVGLVCGLEPAESRRSYRTATILWPLAGVASVAFKGPALLVASTSYRHYMPEITMTTYAIVAGLGGFAIAKFLVATLRTEAARWRRIAPIDPVVF